MSLFFFLFIFTTFRVFAGEVPQVTSEVSQITTSDKISMTSVDLKARNHRRDILYPYDGENETAWDFGFSFRYDSGKSPVEEFSGVLAQALLGRKFSNELNLETGAGIHQLSHGSQSKIIPVADVRSYFIPSSWFRGSLQVHYGFVYTSLMLPGGISDNLTSVSVFPNFSFLWMDSLRTHIRSSVRFLSDGNQRRQVDLSTMVGISTGTPWVWVGVGIDDLRFSKTVASYWSPEQFTAFGPRLEIQAPISGDLSLMTGINLNRFFEGTTWGNGYYFSGRIEYGERNEMNLSLGYVRIESSQNQNKWSSDQFGVNFSASL